MSTDEATAAAERTAALALRLVTMRRDRDRARTIAVHLEAENRAILDAAQNLITNYIGTMCDEPLTCECPLANLTRLIS